jgi:hypothetical protein
VTIIIPSPGKHNDKKVLTWRHMQDNFFYKSFPFIFFETCGTRYFSDIGSSVRVVRKGGSREIPGGREPSVAGASTSSASDDISLDKGDKREKIESLAAYSTSRDLILVLRGFFSAVSL